VATQFKMQTGRPEMREKNRETDASRLKGGRDSFSIDARRR